MSRYKGVGIENFNTALMEQLQHWTTDVQNEVCNLTNEKAEDLKDLIQENAPVARSYKYKKRKKGKYKRSWKVKIISNNFSYYKAVIHAGKEYSLTHLLENGHATRNGGRTEPQVHIKPARDKIEKEYIEGIEKIVKTSQSAGGGYRTAKYKR
jgi:alkyl hydroperoxide reductase subunit AhpF